MNTIFIILILAHFYSCSGEVSSTVLYVSYDREAEMLCIYFYMIMLYIDMTHKGCCYLFILLLLLQLLFNEFFLFGSFVQIVWLISLRVRSFCSLHQFYNLLPFFSF